MDPKATPTSTYFSNAPSLATLTWFGLSTLQRGQGTEVSGSLIIQAEPPLITEHTNKLTIHQPRAKYIRSIQIKHGGRALSPMLTKFWRLLRNIESRIPF